MSLLRRAKSSLRRLVKTKAKQIVTRTPGGPTRLVIFIGHHKVGSTSLQDFLARNAAALAQAGVLYPFVDFQGLSYLSASALRGPRAAGSLPLNIREPHNALAFRMLAQARGHGVPKYHPKLPSLAQMEHAIAQQIRQLQPHTVVLAAEVFANLGPQAPGMIARLMGLCPKAEITVIATLRRIDEYIASWHGQRLKFGHHLRQLSVDGLADHLGTIHFDYRHMIVPWQKALPEGGRLILRDYADVRAAGGSVQDFVAQAGLSLPQGLLPERRENDSLHRGLYEIIRQGNIALPQKEAGLLRRVLRDMTPDLDLPASSQIELFGAGQRARMAQAFAPVAAFLDQQTEGAGFFAKADGIIETLPHSEAEVATSALEQLLMIWPKTGADAPLRDFLTGLTLETRP